MAPACVAQRRIRMQVHRPKPSRRWEQQWADQVARVALAEARNDFYLQQQQLALFGGVQAPAPEARAAGGGRERVRFRGAACPQCGQFCAKMGELWLGCVA